MFKQFNLCLVDFKKNQVWAVNNLVTWIIRYPWSPEIWQQISGPESTSSSKEDFRDLRATEQTISADCSPVCSASLSLFPQPTIQYGTSLLLRGFADEVTAAPPHCYLYPYSVQCLIHSTYYLRQYILVVFFSCVCKVQCNLDGNRTFIVLICVSHLGLSMTIGKFV